MVWPSCGEPHQNRLPLLLAGTARPRHECAAISRPNKDVLQCIVVIQVDAGCSTDVAGSGCLHTGASHRFSFWKHNEIPAYSLRRT